MQESYPAAPGFKTGGTSEDAAAAIAPSAGTLRRHVYELLRATPAGLTADECAMRLNESVLSIRPRCTELCAAGLAKPSGVRRRNFSGRDANVLVLAAGAPATFKHADGSMRTYPDLPLFKVAEKHG
jgi:hypothetical protein